MEFIATSIDEPKPVSLEERVARRLCLGTPSEVDGVLEFLTKLVTNIEANPGDPKYLSIRCAAKALQTKVLNASGGREVRRARGGERGSAFGGSCWVLAWRVIWRVIWRPPSAMGQRES